MTDPIVELARYLKRRERPTGPAPAGWLSAARFTVPNGSLFVGDPYYHPADACVARVPAGTYVLEARLRDLAGEWWVSRLRARLDGCGAPTRGKRIGETCTDHATIAFYDLVAAEEAIAGDPDRYGGLLFGKLTTCGVARIRVNKVLPIAYVRNGFDCGAFVYELRSGRRRVGVEVEIDFEEVEATLADEAAAGRK